jgi:5-methylcytosine-specific restriction endonuclease McrA
MKPRSRQDRAYLLATAQAVALRLRSEEPRIRVRVPTRVFPRDTDGWCAILGDLGKQRPRLEMWFDRFTGYPGRKLWSGFYSSEQPKLMSVVKRMGHELRPIRTVSNNDTTKGKYQMFKVRLPRSQFTAPILEKYNKGYTYYGIYDPTRPASQRVSLQVRGRATAFFLHVVECLPTAPTADERQGTYPRHENRKHVVSHLQRDRSRFLANKCKIRDNYKCRVCGHLFEKVYGQLGVGFAEAHHLVPLSQLRDNVKTRLSDLVTVCANCHRMLHLMRGKRDDVTKLRVVVRRLRASSANLLLRSAGRPASERKAAAVTRRDMIDA